METKNTQTAHDAVVNNQLTASTIDGQTINNLTAFWQNDFKDYHFDRKDPQDVFTDRVGLLSCFFDELNRLELVDLEYINRAVSFYLLHSSNDMYVKEHVIENMSRIMSTVACITQHYTDVSYWSSLFDSLTDALNDAKIPAEPTEPNHEIPTAELLKKSTENYNNLLSVYNDLVTQTNNDKIAYNQQRIKEITERLQDQENTAIVEPSEK